LATTPSSEMPPRSSITLFGRGSGAGSAKMSNGSDDVFERHLVCLHCTQTLPFCLLSLSPLALIPAFVCVDLARPLHPAGSAAWHRHQSGVGVSNVVDGLLTKAMHVNVGDRTSWTRMRWSGGATRRTAAPAGSLRSSWFSSREPPKQTHAAVSKPVLAQCHPSASTRQNCLVSQRPPLCFSGGAFILC
jgi:hypothetical protein